MHLEEMLAENDLRVTRPRRLVWDILTSSNKHLTAQAIAEAVHDQDASVNVSSVYRTLTLFAELNIARETKFGEDGSRWEPAHPDEMIHLVCETCGTVDHHGGQVVSRLRDHLASDHGFISTSINVVVNGTCPACSDPQISS